MSIKQFPKPLPLKKLLGPSFIILALGLGSGEIILWPYLAANYGLGIAWGAVLGITFQFFMNMEIERYTLIKGESVFVGLAKVFKGAPYWFIISTFIGFGLPGIIAASANLIAHVFGFDEFRWLAAAFLVAIGLILSSGRTVYGLMEKITKTVIFIGVPFIFILAVYLATKADWSALASGLIGRGQGYWFLPEGIVVATFLGAFAYAGAGGNLNLTQSIYIKEKGYGMGKYAQKISGLFKQKGQPQKIELAGHDFEESKENIRRFKVWWRRTNIEHLAVFWLTGAVTMSLLMVLAYSTAYGLDSNATGLTFVLNEAVTIGQRTAPLVGSLFLLVAGLMLFQTQLGIMDSTSRIMAENAAIKIMRKNNNSKVKLSKIYAIFVWAQIAFGIILFSLNIYEPKSLIVLAAVINAVCMAVHLFMVNWVNLKTLSRKFWPHWWRRLIIVFMLAFFIAFSGLIFYDKFIK